MGAGAGGDEPDSKTVDQAVQRVLSYLQETAVAASRDFGENLLCVSACLRGTVTDLVTSQCTPPIGTERSAAAAAAVLREMVACGKLPRMAGDPVIQIGLVMRRYGEGCRKCRRVILCLRDTLLPSSPGGDAADAAAAAAVDCQCFDREEDLLLAFRDRLMEMDPDLVLGYNIVGFDMAYLHARAQELGIDRQFMKLGRLGGGGVSCEFVERNLSSSALGDNILRYIDMVGRVTVDIMKVVQRDHRLDSYKLDDVAYHFVKSKKLGIAPKDIFRLYQDGGALDRGRIAEYCVHDCVLCDRLCDKLQIVANNLAMANVCSVPLPYIFMRGQGVKIFSLVSKFCRRSGFLIPAQQQQQQERPLLEEHGGYEGAIVLEPSPGLYLDDPVSVLDYASLYPSSMISENLSHDMLVLDDERWGRVPGVEYNRIEIDGGKVCVFAASTTSGERGIIPGILERLLEMRKATRRRLRLQRVTVDKKRLPLLSDAAVVTTVDNNCGQHATYQNEEEEEEELVCFMDKDDGFPPSDMVVLRSEDGRQTKRVSRDCILSCVDHYDDFQKAVLDGLQLAYKLTANSLYGQMGACTSPLYCRDIAACTTAVGRRMILQAKAFIEGSRPGARVVYGDTDSVMVVFDNRDPVFGASPSCKLTGHAAISASIRTAQEVSREFRKHLKPPHDLEYEKTYWPFLIFSKKRYVGNMYGLDDRSHRLVSMGTVSKRRDNAPIVKKIFDGILHRILDLQDIPASTRFLHSQLRSLARGHTPLEDLVITKSLRDHYKCPLAVAHKVLADRMARRDPGSAPRPSDRIPYLFVRPDALPHLKAQQAASRHGRRPTAAAALLQGDRIEHVDFVREHGLPPDFEFYITNQIMKPVCKLYSVMLDRLPRGTSVMKVARCPAEDPEITARKLLFDEILQMLCRSQPSIRSFFHPHDTHV
jgi:DNA polymerase elongation subunit (family B)